MKARELVEKYQLDLTELELEAEGFLRGMARGPRHGASLCKTR